jgi:hypothetical protein
MRSIPLKSLTEITITSAPVSILKLSSLLLIQNFFVQALLNLLSIVPRKFQCILESQDKISVHDIYVVKGLTKPLIGRPAIQALCRPAIQALGRPAIQALGRPFCEMFHV